MRSRYATAPCGACVCVSTEVVPTSFVLRGRVVRGGVEPGTAAQRWSAGDLSGRHAPVTTPDRNSSREAGCRTRMCVLPRHAGCRHPTSRWIFQVRTAGHEPRPSLRDGARGRNPRPLDEWAAKRIGRCSNPRLLVFSQVLNRLSYRSERNQRKRPGVVVTPGLEEPCFALGAERHKRNGSEARRWIY